VPAAPGARRTRPTPISKPCCYGLLTGQYAYPVRIVCFNAGERWSRDATSDVADALAQRAIDTDADVSAALQDFIAANATRRFDLQLALPLQQ